MTELEEIILSKENALLQPDVRQSAEKIHALLSESFFEIGTSGTTYHYRKGDVFPTGPVNAGDWEILSFTLLPVSPDSVLATYKAIKHTEPDASKKISLRCSLWEKESDEWKLKFHQGAIATEEQAVQPWSSIDSGEIIY